MCAEPFNLKALQSTTHPCTVLCLVGWTDRRADRRQWRVQRHGAGPAGQRSDRPGNPPDPDQHRWSGPGYARADRPWAHRRSTPSASPRMSKPRPGDPVTRSSASTRRRAWVTVCGVEGPHNVNDHYGRTGEEILLTVAGTLAALRVPTTSTWKARRSSCSVRSMPRSSRGTASRRVTCAGSCRSTRSSPRTVVSEAMSPSSKSAFPITCSGVRSRGHPIQHSTRRSHRPGRRRRRTPLGHPADFRRLDPRAVTERIK